MTLIYLMSILPLTIPESNGSAPLNLQGIGQHHPLFAVEKSENPQNVMVFYTKLNASCQIDVESLNAAPIRGNGDQLLFDVYWLMNRDKYKSVHPVLRRSILQKLRSEILTEQKSFTVHVTDLRQLSPDLKNPHVTVRATGGEAGGCKVEALITLGEADQQRSLRLDKFILETQKTLWPPFRKVKSVTVVGSDIVNGEHVSRTYVPIYTTNNVKPGQSEIKATK